MTRGEPRPKRGQHRRRGTWIPHRCDTPRPHPKLWPRGTVWRCEEDSFHADACGKVWKMGRRRWRKLGPFGQWPWSDDD